MKSILGEFRDCFCSNSFGNKFDDLQGEILKYFEFFKDECDCS